MAKEKNSTKRPAAKKAATKKAVKKPENKTMKCARVVCAAIVRNGGTDDGLDRQKLLAQLQDKGELQTSNQASTYLHGILHKYNTGAPRTFGGRPAGNIPEAEKKLYTDTKAKVKEKKAAAKKPATKKKAASKKKAAAKPTAAKKSTAAE